MLSTTLEKYLRYYSDKRLRNSVTRKFNLIKTIHRKLLEKRKTNGHRVDLGQWNLKDCKNFWKTKVNSMKENGCFLINRIITAIQLATDFITVHTFTALGQTVDTQYLYEEI